MSNVLITGSSSGIGMATALELASAGHTVFATMRNPSRAPQLASTPNVTVLTMDVDSDQSVASAMASLDVDVLVNNAGVGPHGAFEELPWDAIRGVMETNYFGALRCIRAVLPRMREQRSGLIINVTSVAGRIASSPLGAYAASKFALEAASEALAQEMRPYGVEVAIVQPGIIDTPMARDIEQPPASTRYPQSIRFSHMFTASLENPVPPSVVAELIHRLIETRGGGKLRHLIGNDAAPFIAWRAAMTDEEWVAWGALGDDEWYASVEKDFGLNARPKTSKGGA